MVCQTVGCPGSNNGGELVGKPITRQPRSNARPSCGTLVVHAWLRADDDELLARERGEGGTAAAGHVAGVNDDDVGSVVTQAGSNGSGVTGRGHRPGRFAALKQRHDELAHRWVSDDDRDLDGPEGRAFVVSSARHASSVRWQCASCIGGGYGSTLREVTGCPRRGGPRRELRGRARRVRTLNFWWMCAEGLNSTHRHAQSLRNLGVGQSLGNECHNADFPVRELAAGAGQTGERGVAKERRGAEVGCTYGCPHATRRIA